MPICPRCRSASVNKDGRPISATQRCRCSARARTFAVRTGIPFAGYRRPREVSALAVHRCTSSRLSATSVRDLLAGRKVDVSARTILTEVQTIGPLLAAAARRRTWKIGTRWRCDEADTRRRGRWAHLHRAIDEDGHVVDAPLREHRDPESAGAFFAQASARSHMAVEGRLHPLRTRQSPATGHSPVAAMTPAQTIRRGEVTAGDGGRSGPTSWHQRARRVVAAFRCLAVESRLAGCATSTPFRRESGCSPAAHHRESARSPVG
jgi:DDE superfamily endonuclease